MKYSLISRLSVRLIQALFGATLALTQVTGAEVDPVVTPAIRLSPLIQQASSENQAVDGASGRIATATSDGDLDSAARQIKARLVASRRELSAARAGSRSNPGVIERNSVFSDVSANSVSTTRRQKRASTVDASENEFRRSFAVADRARFLARIRANGAVRQLLAGNSDNEKSLEPAARGYSDAATRDISTVRNFLRRQVQLTGIDDPDRSMKFHRRMVGTLGNSHVRLRQSYRGIPVYGAEIVAQIDRNGNMISMNGAYAARFDRKFVTQPLVRAPDATVAARAAVPNGGQAYLRSATTLQIFLDDGKPVLAWQVRLETGPTAIWSVFVDALTARIVTKFNEVQSQAASGSGIDSFGVSQSLNIWQSGGSFFMVDTTKPMFNAGASIPPTQVEGGIVILDARNMPPTSDVEEIPDLFFVSSATPDSGWLPDAVSAAKNLSETYDYFSDVHNRESLDGEGGTMRGAVRIGQNFDNAFFIGDTQAMFFGDGDTYAGALDVVAHEMAHGVTSTSANLIYQGQSGALNESFSDIFGEMTERHATGTQDWIVGSGLSTPLRNMQDPGSLIIGGPFGAYPEKMSEYIFTSEDNGGVHLNSSIINRAFYLVAEGLPAAIGTENAEQIWYRALTTKLTPLSDFYDARLALIQSADELFGANSAESQAVAEGFDSVEIFDAGPAPAPTPGPVPGPTGTDEGLLFVFADANGVFLGRRDLGLGDPAGGVYVDGSMTRMLLARRPSVAGNGLLAVYVDSSNDMCQVAVDTGAEDCLNLPGTIHSASISPDGEVFGFVLLDSNQQPENRIVTIDFTNTNLTDSNPDNDDPVDTIYNLVAPAIDGLSDTSVVNADTLDFSSDNRYLIYDALNFISVEGGAGSIARWSIYGIDTLTGETIVLVPPNSDLNLGFPSLAQTNDFRIVFDAKDPVDDSNTVFTGDLLTGETFPLLQTGNWATPAFTGDDSALIFSRVDAGVQTGFSLYRQPLAVDGLNVNGAEYLEIADADYAAPYFRGGFTGAARIDLAMSASIAADLTVNVVDTLNLDVVNNGPDTATNVTIVATVPDGVDYSGVPAGCSASGRQLSCMIATIGSTRNAGVNVSVMPTNVGDISIGASTQASESDSDTSDNTAFASANVSVAAPNPNPAPPAGGGGGSVAGLPTLILLWLFATIRGRSQRFAAPFSRVTRFAPLR